MDFETRHIFPFLIPIIAIVMGVGAGMLAIWTDYARKRHIFELHHKERLAAIDRGMDIPPLPEEFFGNGDRPARPNDHLRRGLVWLLIGLALSLALLLNLGVERAAWGLVPTAVGVAYLIYFAVVRRDQPPR